MNKIHYSIPDISHYRKLLKLTQQDMAVILGVSRLTFIKWEKNSGSMPVEKYTILSDEYNRLIEVVNQSERGE